MPGVVPIWYDEFRSHDRNQAANKVDYDVVHVIHLSLLSNPICCANLNSHRDSARSLEITQLFMLGDQNSEFNQPVSLKRLLMISRYWLQP